MAFISGIWRVNGGAVIAHGVVNSLALKTLTQEIEAMKIEGLKHRPGGTRRQRNPIVSKPVAKNAGTLLAFPTEWTPRQGINSPRDDIRYGIHEDLFSGRFCDFYIGGDAKAQGE